MIKKIIQLYPTLVSRIYVWLRTRILPLVQINSVVPASGRILDIGCGYGFTSIYFALGSAQRQVKGVELSSDRIKVARQAGLGISNLSFDVDNLANNQVESYTTIIAIDLLHHLSPDQKKQLLTECHHLLEKGGMLIVKDINTTPVIKYLWNYLHDLIMTRFEKLDFYSSTTMITALQNSGFIVKQHYPISGYLYPHYLYVCQKS